MIQLALESMRVRLSLRHSNIFLNFRLYYIYSSRDMECVPIDFCRLHYKTHIKNILLSCLGGAEILSPGLLLIHIDVS